MNPLIRRAKKEDMPAVHALIYELAVFEKAPEAVTNTILAMEEDGFGKTPVFHCQVAEVDGEIIGIVIYFIKYSTWKGKGIYLEDLVVTEKMRGKGIGKLLFDAVMKDAVALNAQQLHWQVLDWNQPAIQFYKKYAAQLDEEWINCKLDRSSMEKLLLLG
ncbi:GNAT family N-acetyltransferase [soil metagenome]